MQARVAKTKKEKTAWKLIELFVEALPWMAFVVVLKSPDSGYEIVPAMACHPLDRQVCADIVKSFKKPVED